MEGPMEAAERLEGEVVEARGILRELVELADRHDAGRGGCVCDLCTVAAKARAVLL
jgi:hypothetical protein